MMYNFIKYKPMIMPRCKLKNIFYYSLKNELQFMRNFLIRDDAGFDRTIIGALSSKIVLISGDDLSSIKNEALALGAKYFFEKAHQ